MIKNILLGILLLSSISLCQTNQKSDTAKDAYFAYCVSNAYMWECFTEDFTNNFNTLLVGDVYSNVLILDYSIMGKHNGVTYFQDKIQIEMKARKAFKASMIVVAVLKCVEEGLKAFTIVYKDYKNK